MRVSTKARFAVNALIDLALREGAGPVALSTISQRQRVSLSYLEQMFSGLRRDGMVQSTRGPGGGYTLARDAACITVADIVQAVEEPQEPVGSPADELAGALWERLSDTMVQHMTAVTLQSLVDEQTARGAVLEHRPPRRAVAPMPLPRAVRTLAPNSVFAFGRSFAT
jgi:Rrf2 family iron-sulfur cluster assembly transcriptional regulator